jgi:UDP-N-acetylmuramyl pentapeptide phosphotransferase/UDP-N-acetylglucosamine-1-phosphate transferase
MSINLFVIILAAAFAFAITAFGIPKVIKLAREKRLYDLPGDRTSHSNPTPRLGGAMIFAGVILSSILFTDKQSAFQLKYIIAGMLILFFIGIKDDIISLTPVKKIIGQFFASLVLVFPGNIRIIDCYNLFGFEKLSPIVSFIISIFFVMALINSMNLIDGIDGLASGVGIIASASFGYWFYINNYLSYAVLCGSLSGSLIAFFYFNVFSKNFKIFLGDTGSMLIGFLLALFAINFLELNSDQTSVLRISTAPSITLAILSIPVFDTFRVIIIRLFNKKPLFKADHNHIHHRILSVSKSHLKATGTILLVNISLIIITFLLRALGNAILISSLAILGTILLIVLRFRFQKNNLI